MSSMNFKTTYRRQLSPNLRKRLKKAGRAPLVLGRRLKITPSGRKDMGIQYYIPDENIKNIENLFNYGQSGSGKTWGMMSLIGQSFFKEKRSWVIIDSKGSVSYDTKVYVRKNGKCNNVPIGKIIDKYIPNGNRFHNALDIDDDLYVLSLNDDHKLEWKRVKQVSKHRPTDKILKITTRSGREILATKNHSFVYPSVYGYRPVLGCGLSVGDFIPISNKIKPISEKKRRQFIYDIFSRTMATQTRPISLVVNLAHAIPISFEQLNRIDRINEAVDHIHYGLMIQGDVWWDKIEEIGEIESPSDYVYDFAVEDNENFMLANGAITHNSYRGNNLPNSEYAGELKKYGLKPTGIPEDLMIITAPEYYTRGMTKSELEMDQITHKYRIPIRMANIPILFAMTKLNPDTMYSSAYDANWKRMMARTKRKPTRQDLYDMLAQCQIGQNQTMLRWYDTLISKIRDVEDLTLTENPFSPVGLGLLSAAYDHKPRWIVVTFKRADNSKDPFNLAIYAAVLAEIKFITEIAKDLNFDLRIGLYVDEMQYYVSDKNSIAFQETVEAIYRWGRANRLFRIWGTQTNDHLHKLLQDDIEKFSRQGTYQKVIQFQRMGGPGYCKYMDRQLENAFELDVPYFVPYVKTPPPMFQVLE